MGNTNNLATVGHIKATRFRFSKRGWLILGAVLLVGVAIVAGLVMWLNHDKSSQSKLAQEAKTYATYNADGSLVVAPPHRQA